MLDNFDSLNLNWSFSYFGVNCSCQFWWLSSCIGWFERRSPCLFTGDNYGRIFKFLTCIIFLGQSKKQSNMPGTCMLFLLSKLGEAPNKKAQLQDFFPEKIRFSKVVTIPRSLIWSSQPRYCRVSTICYRKESIRVILYPKKGRKERPVQKRKDSRSRYNEKLPRTNFYGKQLKM